MPRATRAIVNLDALRDNYAQACALAAPATAMAVVKADGYGHGLVPCAQALSDQVDYFAVACIEEAHGLREAGIRQPVVLLEGVHSAGDYRCCVEKHYLPVLHTQQQIRWLESLGDQPLSVWLKVNTGMNRLGVEPQDVAAVIAALQRKPNLQLCGLMTHFACADALGDPMTGEQIAAIAALQQAYPTLPVSAANSAGHFLRKQDGDARFQVTRPGIMLYGGSPLIDVSSASLGLKPVMTLESELIATRELAVGSPVGYGATWIAERPTRMGVVAIGYGDGYPRHAPSGTPVSIKGQWLPLIGRVSMDMLAVDLTDCPQADIGTRVELWGDQLPVDQVARHLGAISYALLTGITRRVPRVYRQGGKQTC